MYGIPGFASPTPEALPPPQKPKFGPLPNPPQLTGGELTVGEAWRLFGIPQMRASRDEVKKRYLEFVARHHPDKHLNDEAFATAQLVRANAAWALLQRHCRW
jgi:hypothetical protein